MLRLRTLGALDLTADGRGAGLRRLLRQRKPLGLLVYLRLRASSGLVWRDRLLATFWPELPQERARRALSQALYVLRKSLGVGLLEGEGQEAVCVDPAQIWCDASCFEETLAEGKLEDALALYGGDLLDGFFVPDAPEFERWLDGERARLRGLAADAARALADREERAGNLSGAARWARRGAELTPYDERTAVRVIELLLAAGDRSGAHHEFRRYCERLRIDLEIEPPAELEQALFERPTPGTPIRATTAPFTVSNERIPPETGEATVGSLEPSGPRRAARRWRLPIVVTTVVTASLLLTAVFAKESRWLQGRGDPGRLLVAPIVNQTGDSALGPLTRLAGDWLGAEIARTGRIRVVPPVYARQVLAGVHAAGDTSSLAVLLAAAARTEASLVVGGNLFGTADSASLEIFGLDPETGEFVFVLKPIPLTVAAPRKGLEQVREATLVAVATRLDERLRDWMTRASPPPSYEAYRRYAGALDVFFEGTWQAQEEATELLIEAWRADTAFTTPLIWALLGMMNTDQGDRADSVAHALEVNASSLADWDHAMLRYVLAWLHGDLRARYRWANEVVAMAPNSELRILQAKAMADVGCRDEALTILNGMDARSGFLDRNEFGYWSLRLDLRQLLGDTAGEVRDARLAQAEVSDELHPGYDYRPLVALVRVAATTGDSPTLAQRLGDLRSLGQGAHAAYLKLLFWGPLDLAPDSPEHRTIVDSAWAWYQDRPQADRDKCWYKNARFNLLYHMERWQEAVHALDDVASGGCLAFPEYGTYRATLAAHLGDVDRARAITDSFPWANHLGSVQLGSQAFWKARVEAIAGEPARAVVYLRAANRKGVPYGALFENTARDDFAGIWDYGPLQQMVGNRDCDGG